MTSIAVLPAGPTLHRRPQTPRRCSWRSLLQPVEWNARYSVDKLLCLFSARPRSRRSHIAILLLTSLPSLLPPLMLELIPLNELALGWRGNGTFLARSWLRVVAFCFAVDNQIQLYIPELTMPHGRMLLMNFLQGGSLVASIVAISVVIRGFPVPFTQISTAPTFVPFCIALRSLIDWYFLRSRWDHTVLRELGREMARVVRIFTTDVTNLLLYSLFGNLFARVPEKYQLLMVAALVLLKMFATRTSWHTAQVARVGVDDVATVQIAFGVRVFHGLFTAMCFQKSKSTWTLALFVIIWVAHDSMVIRDIQLQTQRVLYAHQRCRSPGCGRLGCLILKLRRQQYESSYPAWFASSLSLYRDQASMANTCNECTNINFLKKPAASETEYVLALTKLFQQREAALLRLYVETFVPFVFFGFVTAIKFLPNGKYMPFLIAHDLGDLAWRLGISVTTKLTTFLWLLYVLNHEERLSEDWPSGSHQLAFVLSSLWVIVLSRVIFTTLNTFEFAVAHNGNDMSFQFNWLRSS